MYEWSVRTILGDYQAFIQAAKNDRRKGEEKISEWILSRREAVTGTTLRTELAAVKSLLQYHDILLNWSRIMRMVEPARYSANDRPPTVDEIRKLLSVCDLRMRSVVLILVSSGMRIGGLGGSRYSQYVSFQHNGFRLGVLTVYPGSAEEYKVLISPEAVMALEDYFGARRNIGEKIASDSPLIRDLWNYENDSQKLDPTVARSVSTDSLKGRLLVFWVKAGVRQFNGGKRNEFKQAHGFRKFFKTQAPRGMDPQTAGEDVEILMGHKLSYYKPTFEHLCDQYVKALPYLSVSETAFAERELSQREELLRKKDEQVRELYVMIDRVSQRLAGLEAGIKRSTQLND